LLEKGRSLLPSGIVDVEGDFAVGDPVSCVDREGTAIAKGLVNFSSTEIRKIKGLKTAKIEQVLGHKDYEEVIHRDNLAITGQNPPNKI
jgi:glutamate 5-kinase